MLSQKRRQDLRGRWSDVGKTLFLVLGCYLCFRWVAFEPYVIPSGSMKPTLLIQDYVIVNKWAYGLRLPFLKTWLVGPRVPERGDVVVFRAKKEAGHIMVKRVVGLPGETLVVAANGDVSIDGRPLVATSSEGRDGIWRHETFMGPRGTYQVRHDEDRVGGGDVHEITVPHGQVFLMGDNRDHSFDSRFWGALPLENLLGRASLIWMSCEENDKLSSFLCSPEFFREARIFSRIR